MSLIPDLRGDQPLTRFVLGVAAGTAAERPLIVLPFGVQIVSVTWIPSAAVTANGTNFATLSLRNRGAAGAGAAVPATRSYAATNSVAQVAESMTLSGTAADLLAAAGDVLTLGIAHSGSGLVIPAGLVQLAVRQR